MPKFDSSLTQDLNYFAYCKMLDINFFLKKFGEQGAVPGLKYKLFSEDSYLAYIDDQKLESPLPYEEFRDKYEQLLKENEQMLKKIVRLEFPHMWSVCYVNNNDNCPNCNKTGFHSCEVDFSDKRIKIKDGLVNIQLKLGRDQKPTEEQKIKLMQENPEQVESNQKKQNMTLESCFQEYFQEEEVKYKCEDCSCTESLMHSEIKEYPEVLVLHLKRFKTVYSQGGLKHQKNETLIKFGQEFKVNEKVYRLVGVINHKGELTFGHYTCYALNPTTNQWLFFNDYQVRSAQEQNLNSPENYILFFKIFE